MKDRIALVKGVAATAEVMGTKLTDQALAIMAAELERWPPSEVGRALRLVRTETTGRLTLAGILERIPSWKAAQPPTADEAWEKAIASKLWDEDVTVTVSNAIFRAFPFELWRLKDKIAARRAFIDAYGRESVKSDAHEPHQSLGYVPEGRGSALESDLDGQRRLEHLAQREPPTDAEKARVAQLIEDLRKKMAADARAERPPTPAYQDGEPLPSVPKTY